jgi:pilus assembly protein Flp/PilA
MNNFSTRIFRAASAFRNQRGATMIEYALLAALIAVAAIATMTLLGDGLNDIFTAITTELATAVV